MLAAGHKPAARPGEKSATCAQVIGLAAGQPDFDTPAPIAQAGVAAIEAGKTRYTPNTGTAELRSAIVGKLAADNCLSYAADEIVVSNGAKQSIWQALLAVVAPGDEVIVPAPFWVSYPEMVHLAGAKPVMVPTTAADGFRMTAEQLSAAMTPATRAIILCTPSNPSGAVLSRELQAKYADIVRSHPRALVISDEIYEHIVYAPATHVSFATLPGMWERTLTVNGMSKAFAMTGWRIGYLAAPRHFAKAAAVIQSQSTSGACSISQVRATHQQTLPVPPQALSSVGTYDGCTCVQNWEHAGGGKGSAGPRPWWWAAGGRHGSQVLGATRLCPISPRRNTWPACRGAGRCFLCATRLLSTGGARRGS